MIGRIVNPSRNRSFREHNRTIPDITPIIGRCAVLTYPAITRNAGSHSGDVFGELGLLRLARISPNRSWPSEGTPRVPDHFVGLEAT